MKVGDNLMVTSIVKWWENYIILW